ncbi:MAG: F0F1 ATP synthase subunit delta [Parvularculaceae bacterium]|nr:F0F1 ATP synthase subunit delta [Parvularculaceae bacterium]
MAGIAARYADALFDLALEQRSVDAVSTDLNEIKRSARASEAFRRFLRSPVYSREEQEKTIAAIAEAAKLSFLTRNFLALVARNRRLFVLEAMIDAYSARVAAHRGEVRAEATAAAPLSDDHLRRLRSEIEAMVGKAVILDVRVDPEILGGLVVKVGSTMIDSSLKTKLARLKTRMKEA